MSFLSRSKVHNHTTPHALTQQGVKQEARDGSPVTLKGLEGSSHAVVTGGLPHKIHMEANGAVIRHILKVVRGAREE